MKTVYCICRFIWRFVCDVYQNISQSSQTMTHPMKGFPCVAFLIQNRIVNCGKNYYNNFDKGELAYECKNLYDDT